MIERFPEKVCEEPRPGWRFPNFHSLRRTLATALSQIVPETIVAAVLGHAKSSVTDRYVTVPLQEQFAAVNRAALLIDGEPQENVVPLAAPQKAASGAA